MVVFGVSRLREEDLLLVRSVITVGVGEDEDVRGCRDDDAISEDADAHRRVDARPLVEDLHVVGSSVTVAILEDQDAVAFGASTAIAVVIDDLADPNASAVIYVEVRRTQNHRL